ncbi:MAG: pirin family protein [Planctomycetes bacterium]|nr:pirin family protein [Planctomycetota bacterium]
MITIRKSEERGHANHGWLDAYHTFSFADYYDPEFTGFSHLLVLNQDRVQPGKGFGTHGHKDMEIVTYVLDGVLEHKDSMGNGSQMRHGEVQYMAAGSGVTHSEFNASKDELLHLLQMWVLPRNRNTEPRYEQKEFPEAERRGRLRLVVSEDGSDGSLTIDQDARMYAGSFDAGESARIELPHGRCGWLHVARGTLRLSGRELGPGDGASIIDETDFLLEGVDEAEVVYWELAATARS